MTVPTREFATAGLILGGAVVVACFFAFYRIPPKE